MTKEFWHHVKDVYVLHCRLSTEVSGLTPSLRTSSLASCRANWANKLIVATVINGIQVAAVGYYSDLLQLFVWRIWQVANSWIFHLFIHNLTQENTDEDNCKKRFIGPDNQSIPDNNTNVMSLFHWDPMSHDGVKTSRSKWKSDTINFIINTSAFTTVALPLWKHAIKNHGDFCDEKAIVETHCDILVSVYETETEFGQGAWNENVINTSLVSYLPHSVIVSYRHLTLVSVWVLNSTWQRCYTTRLDLIVGWQ